MLHRAISLSAVVFFLLIGSPVTPAAAKNANAVQSRVDNVSMDPVRGTAEVVSGEFLLSAAADYPTAAVNFIDSRSDLFGLKQARNELRVLRQETDQLGETHVRMDQMYQGLRVWGCQKIVHFKDPSTIYMVAGQTISTPDISTTPAITVSSADGVALSSVKNVVGSEPVTTSSELLVLPQKSKGVLAYLVTVQGVTNGAIRWRVFVDAQKGTVLEKYNDIQDDGPTVGTGIDVNNNTRTLQTYQIGSTFEMVDASRPMFVPPISNLHGVIATYNNLNHGGSLVTDPNGDDNFNDNLSLKAAVSGHYYAGLTYQYYKTSIGRNSFDNAGSSIIVNVHDPAYVNNAYWDGAKLNFCDGDGTNYKNFAGGLDVVAHELTHGVTQYTAGLLYQFQPGALNESMSDFFAAMVDSANWLIGEEIRITAPGFLRNMQDPHQGPNPTLFPFGYQPARLSEYVDSGLNYDNGGVHVNSGIPNRGGYLVGSVIGRPKAAQIWYRTLTVYLTPNSDFNFWATMLLQSATDLYGDPSTELTSVVNALDSLGFPLIFVNPNQLTPLPAALGALSDTAVSVRNRRSETVTLQSYTTALGKVTVTGTFPTTLNSGDSTMIHIRFDATSGYTACNLGTILDTVILNTSSIVVPTVRIPVAVGLGYVKTVLINPTISSACLATGISNSPSVTSFSRNAVNALSKATLMVGYKSGADTIVYMDLYSPSTFATIDTFSSSLAPSGDSIKQVRITSQDGQVQGVLKYQYNPTSVAACGYVVADYTLFNKCTAPIVTLSGVLSDFDMPPSTSTNQCNFDAINKLVYIRDAGNTEACGLAMLSGTPRNLRAINNPAYIYNGLTAGTAYSQMASTSNLASSTADDWSALLTFGQDTLKTGDSAHYRIAFLYSTTGSSGLAPILSQIPPVGCCVGNRGNVNQTGAIDLADLSALVSYLTGGGFVPPCMDAANVNGSGTVDLADLSALVSYLTGGGFTLVPCP